jgi:hypothetical protein
MKETYKFEKAFGPVASFSGILIFLAGLVATYFSLTGLVLVFLGAFIGFTNSSTTIDFANRKVKFSNNIFGFIKTGKWFALTESMKIGLKKSNKIYRTYSRSNRILDIANKGTKIYLFDLHGVPIMPLKSIDNSDNMGSELENISNKLGLTTII